MTMPEPTEKTPMTDETAMEIRNVMVRHYCRALGAQVEQRAEAHHWGTASWSDFLHGLESKLNELEGIADRLEDEDLGAVQMGFAELLALGQSHLRRLKREAGEVTA